MSDLCKLFNKEEDQQLTLLVKFVRAWPLGILVVSFPCLDPEGTFSAHYARIKGTDPNDAELEGSINE